MGSGGAWIIWKESGTILIMYNEKDGMEHPLSDKVALITGGTRGLGKAMARALGARGARVALNYAHDHRQAEHTVDWLQDDGITARSFCSDITNEASCQDLVVRIENTFGPVDIVVNNATGPQPFKNIEQQNWDDYLDQMNYFVKAPLFLAQATLASMKSRRWGRIINIGSEVVELGNPEFGHYVSAKAAMLGLTRSWAHELGPFGITCNLIAPGWIPVERHSRVPDEDKEKYISGVPLGFQGSPGDIGEMVAFLSSGSAGFITGQKIAVNGGNTLL